MALMIGGAVAAVLGLLLMDAGPDWLTAVLTRGGVFCFVAGLVVAVAATVGGLKF